VLDSRDANVAVDQRGGETRVADVLRTRMQFDGRIEVGTAEYDARIRRRGTKRHVHLVTGMETDARGANDVLERALLDHVGQNLVAAALSGAHANTVLTSE